VLLTGQRAVPEKAERLGFRFSFPTLDSALADIVGRSANSVDIRAAQGG
jgi:NAD dependent epimerase/dehydratase family enzyme